MNAALLNILPNHIPDFGQYLNTSAKTVYLNVFVHGSYGATASVLNLTKIAYDDDTAYSNQEYFVRQFLRQRIRLLYESSLMYEEGWWLVNPTNLDNDKAVCGMALKPIIKAFLQTQKHVDPEAQNLCYLFGWSGLLSQTARAKAAVALFNGLVQQRLALQQFLKAQNSLAEVKVRIYCHSHGGNVALNLAWLDAIEHNSLSSLISLYAKLDLAEMAHSEIIKITKMLAKLPIVSERKTFYGMDEWLFKPLSLEKNNRICDELVLMAAPIQSETSPLALATCFGKTYNYYSEDDHIQDLDRVSTSTRKCARTVDPIKVKAKFGQRSSQQLQQINISFKPHFKSLFKRLLTKSTLGPAHRDFWLISWNCGLRHIPIRPMPLICLAPWLNESLRLATEIASPWTEMQFYATQVGMLPKIAIFDRFDNSKLPCQAKIPQELIVQLKQTIFACRQELENSSAVTQADSMARHIHSLASKVINFMAR